MVHGRGFKGIFSEDAARGRRGKKEGGDGQDGQKGEIEGNKKHASPFLLPIAISSFFGPSLVQWADN